MRTNAKLLLLISLLLSISALANAQFSLKPKPLPDCKTFLISEIGYFYRINSPPDGLRKHPHYFVSNWGLMINLSEKLSMGATSYLSYAKDGGLRAGLKVRGRRWLGSENSINIAGGIILWDSHSKYSSPDFSGNLSFSIRDMLILELLLEILPYDFVRWDYTFINGEYTSTTTHYKGSDLALYSGMKTGSGWKAGFILNSAVLIGGAILFGLYAISGEH